MIAFDTHLLVYIAVNDDQCQADTPVHLWGKLVSYL